jgi:hypothetical protein
VKATEITIRVEPAVAQIYLTASDQQKRKLDALLSLRLSEAGRARPLQDVIRDAAAEAKANGMTPAILEEILGGE